MTRPDLDPVRCATWVGVLAVCLGIWTLIVYVAIKATR